MEKLSKKLFWVVVGSIVTTAFAVIVGDLLGTPDMRERIAQLPQQVAGFWPVYSLIVAAGVVYAAFSAGRIWWERGTVLTRERTAVTLSDTIWRKHKGVYVFRVKGQWRKSRGCITNSPAPALIIGTWSQPSCSAKRGAGIPTTEKKWIIASTVRRECPAPTAKRISQK